MSVRSWILTGILAVAGGSGALAVQDGALDEVTSGVPAMVMQVGDGFVPEHGRGGRGGERLDLSEEAREFLGSEMRSATAEMLGLTVEELEAAREDGTRMPKLIEEAGLTAEEFREAMNGEFAEVVQAALEAGLVTDEQATQLNERGWRGPRGGGRGHGHGHGHGRGEGALGEVFPREARAEVTAEVLGITVDELAEAREAGQRLPELAEENGVTMAEVEAAVADAASEAISEAVEDGTLTQEQGDLLVAGMEAKAVEREIMAQAVADALGITTDELAAYRASETDMRQIVEGLGLDSDEVRMAIEVNRTAAIAEAVDEGTLTAQQGAWLLGAGGRGHGGHGEHGRGPGNAPRGEAAPAEAAPLNG